MRQIFTSIRQFVLLGLFLLAFSCTDSPVDSVSTGQVYTIDFIPAKTNNELDELRRQKNNMIKTKEDLNRVLKMKSPLTKIESAILDDFIDALVFRDGVGVVGLKFRDIKDNLSQDQYNEVMAMFGIDTRLGFWAGASSRNLRTAEDYHGYYCKSKGNCHVDSKAICLSGC